MVWCPAGAGRGQAHRWPCATGFSGPCGGAWCAAGASGERPSARGSGTGPARCPGARVGRRWRPCATRAAASSGTGRSAHGLPTGTGCSSPGPATGAVAPCPSAGCAPVRASRSSAGRRSGPQAPGARRTSGRWASPARRASGVGAAMGLRPGRGGCAVGGGRPTPQAWPWSGVGRRWLTRRSRRRREGKGPVMARRRARCIRSAAPSVGRGWCAQP
jgi:hypothetical protein